MLALKLTDGFKKLLLDAGSFNLLHTPELFRCQAGQVAMPVEHNRLLLCGPTPYMRFMKYFSGGMHAPHYDALYENKQDRYTTLMSWVLYLNTSEAEGGAFQFVEDGQGALPLPNVIEIIGQGWQQKQK